MLAIGKVQEIKRLLAEGKLSQRKIAKAVGVGRSTVSDIASGRRPDYESMRDQRLAEFEPLGPIERCPSCGGRVYMPCRLCRVRKITAHQQARQRALALAATTTVEPSTGVTATRRATRQRDQRDSARAA